MFGFAMLVIFVGCALGYGVATRRLQRLEDLRIEKHPPLGADPTLLEASRKFRRIGLSIAPTDDELKRFCEREGLAEQYHRATRMLYGSIAVATLCLVAIVATGAHRPR